jgi:hypothetical protein
MKTTAAAAVLATLGSASAFVAPSAFAGNAVAQSVKSSSAMRMADASALGQGKPFGDDTIFDPLGLAEKATPLELKKYQEVRESTCFLEKTLRTLLCANSGSCAPPFCCFSLHYRLS